ncbi:PfkB family carbohydrate kinase [Thermoflavifilum thermophilum]|uniref:Sugar or nucleoside kinase, ribokinase family n=1 Tax=Thermoflavifilum thermophilum TaxID=1393122 RepID=A0A1I7NA98_9BACT|nr:PfkB family carbohydrate kinase [Thermoflavifilum thermophilum]SFV31523.1 Sugar or nucleoside kinase, ribokinase family [Thermoflavifilum thermophilum]
MSLLVVGSMAFDSIETPFGKTDRIVGGAATYIAWAASCFVQPVQQISVVGGDFPEQELKELQARGVDLGGVQVKKDQKSFYWAGRYHLDMNSRDTLVTELNVLADFQPVVPESFQSAEYVMLGNLSPVVQMNVIEQLRHRPRLIAMDTMNFWMNTQMEELKKVLTKVDALLINDAEARQLSGEYSLVKAARAIHRMGPRYLVIKKGEHGALLFYKNHAFFAPALPLEEVFDPTGAGDTFAGGFMGYIAHTQDLSFENMKTAVVVGSALASFCVEKFGVQRLKEISQEDIETRIRQFVDLMHFDIDLVQ